MAANWLKTLRGKAETYLNSVAPALNNCISTLTGKASLNISSWSSFHYSPSVKHKS